MIATSVFRLIYFFVAVSVRRIFVRWSLPRFKTSGYKPDVRNFQELKVGSLNVGSGRQTRIPVFKISYSASVIQKQCSSRQLLLQSLKFDAITKPQSTFLRLAHIQKWSAGMHNIRATMASLVVVCRPTLGLQGLFHPG